MCLTDHRVKVYECHPLDWVNFALITKIPEHTYLLFNIWSWCIHEIKTCSNYLLPLVWNESIAGNQHNVGKFGRVTVHSHGGQCRGCNPGGGHWPRKGVWGCAALKTPFSRLSCRLQGSHFKQKSQFTRPLLRKFGNCSLNSLNFHPNFSSQAPKFGNFQFTSPQIWKFSAHKPPNLEIFRSQAPLFRGKCQFASPTLQKSGPHTLTWKKVECPPWGL